MWWCTCLGVPTGLSRNDIDVCSLVGWQLPMTEGGKVDTRIRTISRKAKNRMVVQNNVSVEMQLTQNLQQWITRLANR